MSNPRVATATPAQKRLGLDTIAHNATPSANSDAPWKLFAPEWYSDHNYRTLRDDDREIMRLVRDYFAEANVRPSASGIDVGAGANLYPSFAMLPFCEKIELREFSEPNVAWLEQQVNGVKGFDKTWDDFWAVYRESRAYQKVPDPRAALAKKASVLEASVFDLPRTTWDVGTMFFVACSLSTEIDEFHRAVHSFVRALKPDAPFAAAFMENSKGYTVDGIKFPAVQVGKRDIERSLASVAYNVQTKRIPTDSPLRDGYRGMILAWGRSRQPT